MFYIEHDNDILGQKMTALSGNDNGPSESRYLRDDRRITTSTALRTHVAQEPAGQGSRQNKQRGMLNNNIRVEVKGNVNIRTEVLHAMLCILLEAPLCPKSRLWCSKHVRNNGLPVSWVVEEALSIPLVPFVSTRQH